MVLAGDHGRGVHAGDHAVAVLRASGLLPVNRQRAEKALGGISDWLIAHLRTLEIAAGLLIGLPFLVKGLAAL